MTEENEPIIGTWLMSLKEMANLAICVDAHFMGFLSSGIAIPPKELSVKIVNDFCHCLVTTGICSNEIAAEVYEQILKESIEGVRKIHATPQLYKGRVKHLK